MIFLKGQNYKDSKNIGASQVALVVKNHLPMQEIRDMGSIPGSGRSPERGNGKPLQYSYLENPLDRGNGFQSRAINRQSTKDFGGSENTLYIIQIDTWHYTFF